MESILTGLICVLFSVVTIKVGQVMARDPVTYQAFAARSGHPLGNWWANPKRGTFVANCGRLLHLVGIAAMLAGIFNIGLGAYGLFTASRLPEAMSGTGHQGDAMNYVTMAVGLVFVIAGIFFLYRSLSPQAASGKLKGMMEMWGESKGLWLYRVSYVGIPFILGALLLRAGYMGQSLGDFL